MPRLAPTRTEWLLFAALWVKFLVFLALVASTDRMSLGFGGLHTLFSSLLRPVYFSLAILVSLACLNAFGPRRRTWAFAAFDLLLTGLLLADLWYYRAFRMFPSINLVRVTGNLDLTPDLVWPLVRKEDALLLLDLVLLKAVRFPPQARRDLGRLAFQAGVYLGLFMLVSPVAGDLLGSNAALHPFDRKDSFSTMHKLSPLGYHVLNAVAWAADLDQRNRTLSPDQRARIETWLAANQEHLPPSPTRGLLAGRNLLVIQVESLEYFPLDLKAGDQEVTPTLNALKRRGLCFTEFHEMVGAGCSSDADLMTNASFYPVRRDPTFCFFPNATLPSLPRALKARGYTTLSAHPDRGSMWNTAPGLLNLGFDRCLDCSAYTPDDVFGMGLSDATFLNQTLEKLKAVQRPFYAFVVTLSSHEPFQLPWRLRELPLPPGLDAEPMGDYLQSIHYTDKHLGRLLAGLDQAGILDDTVVVVTGDHQGVHKYYGPDLLRSPFHQPQWDDPERRIPLLIAAKGLPAGTVATHGGHVDLMPTLLDLLGVEDKVWGPAMMGRNLLNTRRNLAVLADGTLKGEDAGAGAHCREGLEIADLVIRSDYFRTRPRVGYLTVPPALNSGM